MTSSFARAVVRFAPSPNGYLHLGHAYSALMNALLARETGGRMLLRLENIDTTRCRPEFETAIREDLGWLGVTWEEPARRQSEHFDDYAEALERLERRGLVYPCFCSRGDIMAAVAARPTWPLDPDGTPLYPGSCKHIPLHERSRRFASGERASYRLDMERALAVAGAELSWSEFRDGAQRVEERANPAVWGDAVLSRKDIATSYHIAVVVDDAVQGVTDIVRGEDLFMATSLHRILQALLDLPPPNYRHHGLLRDASGHKLSKSLRAKPLRQFRQERHSVESVLGRIGVPKTLLGRSLEDIVASRG
jgi:glutamyl-Q tRNA(Asp) synthetase